MANSRTKHQTPAGVAAVFILCALAGRLASLSIFSGIRSTDPTFGRRDRVMQLVSTHTAITCWLTETASSRQAAGP